VSIRALCSGAITLNHLPHATRVICRGLVIAPAAMKGTT
jgi:hypothetical protein